MTDGRICINLLDGPAVTTGGLRRAVPDGAQRFLVLMAFRRHVSRAAAAAVLWPDVEARRAAGNLRSALWRLRRADLPLIAERAGQLILAPDVTVDLDRLCGELTLTDLPIAMQALDLLPGWYENWLDPERDRLRELVMGGLEHLAVGLWRRGRCADAIEAALLAIGADPLRDRARAVLITAHLAEGNLGEARRAYTAYQAILLRELGREPPERLRHLVGI